MIIKTTIRVTNESDADPPIFEKDFEKWETKYDDMVFDENKVCQYNWVQRLKLEPIKVMRGQHFHLT